MRSNHATRRRLLIALGVALPLLPVGAPSSADQVVRDARAIVVSGHAAASEAGLDVLRNGGHAIDAAVTVSLALGVAEPYGSGLGGKLVLLYYDAGERRVHGLQALTESSADLDVEALAGLPAPGRRFGYASVCIPALPFGLYAAHDRWGTREWEGLVQPAIDLAREGLEITAHNRGAFTFAARQLRDDPEAARLYLRDGRAPSVGARLANEDLARTLERFARHGPRIFQEGPLADRIVEAVREGGGWMTHEDLKSYRSRFIDPPAASAGAYEFFGGPPPATGGATVLLSLLCAAQESWEEVQPRSAEQIERLARILQQVYPPIHRVVGDVPGVHDRLPRLFEPDHVRSLVDRARDADPRNPLARIPGSPPRHDVAALAGTTHFIVVDEAGNIVCATQSIGHRFGAGVIAPGAGFFLNNDMSNFAVFSPHSVNYIEPGKRARSTIAPIIAFRDQKPFLALGSVGGQRIPTAVLQVMHDVIHLDVALEASVELPRFHLQRPLSRQDPPNAIDLEHHAPGALDDELSEKGWRVERHASGTLYFGGVNAVQFTAEGRVTGVADTRRGNAAKGY